MQSPIYRRMHLNDLPRVKMDVLHLAIEITPWWDVVVVAVGLEYLFWQKKMPQPDARRQHTEFGGIGDE